MGFDQAHEQNNKIVKVDGGAIGILEDADTLLEWSLAGPYISQIINGSEADREFRYHHEDTQSFDNKFRSHQSMLLDSFSKFGNPFQMY